MTESGSSHEDRRDTTGQRSTFKARFVVKGFRQIEGRDYGELYASVAHKDSIRALLAIVNHHDLECDQVDIKGAFLNGTIDKLIHLEPPEGGNVAKDTVLRLRKSIYGLKQSLHRFNKALDKWLQSEGLNPTTADPCVYIRRRNGHVLFLCVHVDDPLIACDDRIELEEFKSALNRQFECSDSGPVG